MFCFVLLSFSFSFSAKSVLTGEWDVFSPEDTTTALFSFEFHQKSPNGLMASTVWRSNEKLQIIEHRILSHDNGMIAHFDFIFNDENSGNVLYEEEKIDFKFSQNEKSQLAASVLIKSKNTRMNIKILNNTALNIAFQGDDEYVALRANNVQYLKSQTSPNFRQGAPTSINSYFELAAAFVANLLNLKGPYALYIGLAIAAFVVQFSFVFILYILKKLCCPSKPYVPKQPIRPPVTNKEKVDEEDKKENEEEDNDKSNEEDNNDESNENKSENDEKE